MPEAAFLIILFNASNWGTYGAARYRYDDMPACARALTDMKIANEKPNSGVAVVAFCSPKETAVPWPAAK